MATVIHFRRCGGVRAIHDDAFPFEKAFGREFVAARRRASLINTVETGPHAGDFYADMSFLADLTGDDSHRVCLLPPKRLESDVKRDEFAYVRDNYIVGEKIV